ncbi:MAG: PIN domain-containing protein [Anaerolineales bacterium]|jgi:predicted nucleic acid-binding protein
MIRIFLDSSVLFSAAYSSTGYSRDLLLMAARGEIILVISPHVVTETRRNLIESAPDAIPYLELLFDIIPFEYIKPAKRDVLSAAKHVAQKDAPIIAAAKRAKVDFLVTLDKRHLLGRPELAAYVGTRIVAPKSAVESIRSTN